MSRIRRLRSMTLTLSRLSSAFCCPGDSSSSATSRSKPVSLFAWLSASALPLPTYQFGSIWRRFCHSAPTTSAPAVVARFASSASESSALQPPSSPVSTATRKAFSTGGLRSMRFFGLIGSGEDSPRPSRPLRQRPPDQIPCHPDRSLDELGVRRVEPLDRPLGPEPRALAAGEGDIALGVEGDRGPSFE